MNTFKNAIGWSLLVSCVLAAGCTLEGGVSEGDSPETVAGTSENLSLSKFSGWTPIGSGALRFKFGAAITSPGPGTRVVYALNNLDSHMMTTSWTQAFGWQPWADLLGVFTSKPAATTWRDGAGDHYFVVSRGADNAFWFKTSVGHSSSGWLAIPGRTFDSAPAAARLGFGKIVVCGRTGTQIYCATNTV